MMLNSDTCKTARLEGADRAPLCPLWSARCGDVVIVVYCTREVRSRVPRLGSRVETQTRPMDTLQTLHAMETQTRPIEWTLCTVEWSGVDASGVSRVGRTGAPRALPRRGCGPTGYRIR